MKNEYDTIYIAHYAGVCVFASLSLSRSFGSSFLVERPFPSSVVYSYAMSSFVFVEVFHTHTHMNNTSYYIYYSIPQPALDNIIRFFVKYSSSVLYVVLFLDALEGILWIVPSKCSIIVHSLLYMSSSNLL